MKKIKSVTKKVYIVPKIQQKERKKRKEKRKKEKNKKENR